MTVLSSPVPRTQRPGLRRAGRLSAGVAALLVSAALATVLVRVAHDDSRRDYLAASGWPEHGQAAYVLGFAAPHASPAERAVPIASLAKVMTAYLVLRAAPLHRADDGFALRVTRSDVADTHARAGRDESVVAVAAGEILTERQALAALLLPSANNVAIMLARRTAGSVAAFVRRMNRTALAFGMRRTRYTDPSGFDPATRSTAADQLVLAGMAMRDETLAELVGMRSYRLPVAGTVHNTDRLLGAQGFVGIKTGSDDAAGGCFMFRTRRVIGGAPVELTGVLLGQRGHSLLAAGMFAARQLAARVFSGHLPVPTPRGTPGAPIPGSAR